jgi:glycosyltransferase involved in cell wall biosynthesis
MKSIGLCVIAKNEADALPRCIRSARPLIDYVLVIDTGSTDGTQAAVRDLLRDTNLSGEVIDEPWRDFAYNRTHALQQLRMRERVDYSLMVDADQVIVLAPDFSPAAFKAELNHDVYDVRIKFGDIEYFLPQLASNRLDIVYKGVLHEYRELPKHASRARADGFSIEEVRDGARSRDVGKYQNDAALLELALAGETDPFLIARYTFYLAQSHRDSGNDPRALELYLKRAELGYWDEEVFLSLYHVAQIRERLGVPDSEVVYSYLGAYEACPRRTEALHGAVRFLRLRERFHQAYLIGRQAIDIACPETGLFVERWIYDYGLLDEFAVSAYWSGHFEDCLTACIKILEQAKIPADQRERIRRNAQFAAEKLGRSIFDIPP